MTHLKHFKACSLWCNEGTSDKVYDMQLVPNPTNPALFSVYAQHGKRLATKLVTFVVAENVSLESARSAYGNKFDEKAGKGRYQEVSLARLSAKRAAENEAAIRALATAAFDGAVFEWPEDLKDMVESVEEALGMPLGTSWLHTSPRAVSVLMLADVSLGLPEGPFELVPAIYRDRRWGSRVSRSLVLNRLSPAVEAGLAAQQNRALAEEVLANELLSLCVAASS